MWHLPVLEAAIGVVVQQSMASLPSALDTLDVILHAALDPFPLTVNQKLRVARHFLESRNEPCLSAFLHRFPELAPKIDRMCFEDPDAEALRRRIAYRVLYEPGDSS